MRTVVARIAFDDGFKCVGLDFFKTPLSIKDYFKGDLTESQVIMLATIGDNNCMPGFPMQDKFDEVWAHPTMESPTFFEHCQLVIAATELLKPRGILYLFTRIIPEHPYYNWLMYYVKKKKFVLIKTLEAKGMLAIYASQYVP